MVLCASLIDKQKVFIGLSLPRFSGACSNSCHWLCHRYWTLVTDSVGASFNLGMVPIIVAWSPLFLKTKRRAHLLERQHKPYPTFTNVNKRMRLIVVGISLPSCGHKLVTNDHKLRLSPFPGSLLADSWERQLYVCVFFGVHTLIHDWFVSEWEEAQTCDMIKHDKTIYETDAFNTGIMMQPELSCLEMALRLTGSDRTWHPHGFVQCNWWCTDKTCKKAKAWKASRMLLTAAI